MIITTLNEYVLCAKHYISCTFFSYFNGILEHGPERGPCVIFLGQCYQLVAQVSGPAVTSSALLDKIFNFYVASVSLSGKWE